MQHGVQLEALGARLLAVSRSRNPTPTNQPTPFRSPGSHSLRNAARALAIFGCWIESAFLVHTGAGNSTTMVLLALVALGLLLLL